MTYHGGWFNTDTLDVFWPNGSLSGNQKSFSFLNVKELFPASLVFRFLSGLSNPAKRDWLTAKRVIALLGYCDVSE